MDVALILLGVGAACLFCAMISFFMYGMDPAPSTLPKPCFVYLIPMWLICWALAAGFALRAWLV